MYVDHLVEVFRGVWRVMKDTGTLFVNIGDCHASGKGQSANKGSANQEDRYVKGASLNRGHQTIGGKHRTRPADDMKMLRRYALKPKDLVGIPWMLAFALRHDGWYLRNDVIWQKTNPMCESVNDRMTKGHEYIFFMTKSDRYYYDQDAVRTPHAPTSIARALRAVSPDHKWNVGAPGSTARTCSKPRPHQDASCYTEDEGYSYDGRLIVNPKGANLKTVWSMPTASYRGAHAHYAMFPEELPERCIKAGCPDNGIVLDPFMGSGTTAVAALKLQRSYTGIELNAEYAKAARQRISHAPGRDLLHLPKAK
jgi:DNA modification methylase